MNYKVLKNKKLSELEKEVNTYTRSGWVVAGGIEVQSLSHINGTPQMFYQAMKK